MVYNVNTGPMTTNIKIYIDDRERGIAPLFTHGIPVETKRMHVGDYAVSVNGNIVAVIERKTLADFAASLKDGRYSNISKMRELREQLGIQMLFFVEGKPPKNPTNNVSGGRIPYAVIEAAIDHLAVRDNISTVFVKDIVEFVSRLSRFAKNMSTLYHNGDVRGGRDEDVLGVAPRVTDDDIVVSMWCCIKGIGAINAVPLGRIHTISDVVNGRIPTDGMNKKITKSLVLIDPRTQSRLLECIPGVSKGIANDLLRECTLKQLLSYPCGGIAIKKVGKTKKNLGDALAAKIVKYFNMKLTISSAENIKCAEGVSNISTESADVKSSVDVESSTNVVTNTTNDIDPQVLEQALNGLMSECKVLNG